MCEHNDVICRRCINVLKQRFGLLCIVSCEHSFANKLTQHTTHRLPVTHTFAQAKDLVEAAPCVVLAKVKAEDAKKIVEKLKAETGAEFEIL